MKSVSLISFFMLMQIFAQAQINPSLAEELQTILDNSVNLHGNNGVSAHLIMPNRSEWGSTAGVGKDNITINDSTVFHGASTTKFNVALAMMLLKEEGLVDLDKSYHQYLDLNEKFDTTITVRQLLNHTSGIADYLETGTSGADVINDFNNFYSPTFIIENIINDTPLFPVGTSFRYSNSNYLIAALVIEAVTGNPLHIELRNRIWDPLEMNHTYFGGYETPTEPLAGVWWNFGNGVQNYSNESTTSMLSYAYGAGNIVTCPADLSKLLYATINHELVSETTLNEMVELIPASFASWTDGYGLGMHRLNGIENTIGHDGFFTNMTDMFYSENYGFTLVTMTNTLTEWLKIYKDMYAVLETYFLNTSTEELSPTTCDVYPNPSSGIFQVQSSYLMEEILVTDTFGKIHYSAFANDYTAEIPLKQAGIYFIKINTKQSSVTKKIMVTD